MKFYFNNQKLWLYKDIRNKYYVYVLLKIFFSKLPVSNFAFIISPNTLFPKKLIFSASFWLKYCISSQTLTLSKSSNLSFFKLCILLNKALFPKIDCLSYVLRLSLKIQKIYKKKVKVNLVKQLNFLISNRWMGLKLNFVFTLTWFGVVIHSKTLGSNSISSYKR